MVKLVRDSSSLGTNTSIPIYLLGRQKNNPLLNLQYYSLFNNNQNNNNQNLKPITNTNTHKPQHGESKYTSSLYVGKMHKIISKN
jgi:hypothetical protein